jgi:mono/diheme cytochrome c family protein
MEAAQPPGQGRVGRAGMSVSWRLSLSRRVGPAAVVITALLGLVVLPGCDETYNEDMVYTKRSDPVILDPSRLNAAFAESPDPDRPGQLPLFRMANFDNPHNPFYPDKNKLLPLYADATKLTGPERDVLDQILNERFGKPAAPKVDIKPAEQVADLKLDEATLKEGSKLYRLHCLQCHGLNGDGRGPTSKWVNPHPRDYRAGLFKFQSVDQVADARTLKPRRDDLFRTLHQGVEGTSMPSFNMLPDHELHALVSYVIHLSIRGEAELEGLRRIARGDADLKVWLIGTRRKEGTLTKILAEWHFSQAPDKAIKPGPYKPPATEEEKAESIKKGLALYQANCGACHQDYGRQAFFKMDEWGTLLKPQNLTTGVYRGGRRPIDLYWRIHSGINGSGMARQGGIMDSDAIWNVVNFLQVLPYPAMRSKYGIDLN